MGIPLLRGRDLDSRDGPNTLTVLVNETMARRFWPGEDPIGKQIGAVAGKEEWEIIGVVGDVRWNIAQPPRATMYWPIYGNGNNGGTIVVRAKSDVESLTIPIQKIVADLDRDLPVFNVMTIREAIGKSTIDSEFDSILVLGFAVIALVLAAAGLYGVLAYLVAQRTTEFGIRLALGAQRKALLRLLLFDGLKPALIGLLLGLPAAGALVRLIRSMLYQTEPADPIVFTAVGLLLMLVALAACLIPAWHGSRVEPMQALRTE